MVLVPATNAQGELKVFHVKPAWERDGLIIAANITYPEGFTVTHKASGKAIVWYCETLDKAIYAAERMLTLTDWEDPHVQTSPELERRAYEVFDELMSDGTLGRRPHVED